MLSGIILIIFLLLSTVTDLKEKKIYLKLSVIFFIAGILLDSFNLNISLYDAIFAMTIGFALIGISFLTREKIGIGDGIIFCVTGVYLGFWGNLFLLTAAFFLSACFSAGALILRKADRTSRIPMLPFILIPAIYEIFVMGAL